MQGEPATAYPPGKLRRIALDQQGLLRAAPFGQGLPATYRAIRHLGYVQIDTISVVERAHHHVLRTRVPNYRPAYLDTLLRQRKVFEYWYHAAAFLPMEDYRYSLPHMQAMRSGDARWLRSRDQPLMAQVLQRVASDGPLRARDFEDPRESRQGWWDWKPAKRALEQLFMQGDLMVVGREGFQKIYDLTERVLPADIDTRTPTTREVAEHLIDNAIRSHGFATAKCMTYLRQGAPVRKALQAALQTRCADGRLVSFRLSNGERVYGDPQLTEGRAPSAPSKVRILSPFDNALIQRDRNLALFDFDYQVECYVPEEKRRFGYFCLPILYRDRLIGRMDVKAHRRDGRLDVKALHLQDVRFGGEDDDACGARIVDRLADAIGEFAAFNGCDHVNLLAVFPRRWRRCLDTALDDAMGKVPVQHTPTPEEPS